jgi:hypothetical protein
MEDLVHWHPLVDLLRDAAQRPAQQVWRVFFDVDLVGKVAHVFEGEVLFLAAIAVLMDTTRTAPSCLRRGCTYPRL